MTVAITSRSGERSVTTMETGLMPTRTNENFGPLDDARGERSDCGHEIWTRENHHSRTRKAHLCALCLRVSRLEQGTHCHTLRERHHRLVCSDWMPFRKDDSPTSCIILLGFYAASSLLAQIYSSLYRRLILTTTTTLGLWGTVGGVFLVLLQTWFNLDPFRTRNRVFGGSFLVPSTDLRLLH